MVHVKMRTTRRYDGARLHDKECYDLNEHRAHFLLVRKLAYPCDCDKFTDAPAAPVHEEAPEPVHTVEEAPSIDDMTVAELKEHAAEHDIDLGDATKKDDIKAAIVAHDAPLDEEG